MGYHSTSRKGVSLRATHQRSFQIQTHFTPLQRKNVEQVARQGPANAVLISHLEHLLKENTLEIMVKNHRNIEA